MECVRENLSLGTMDKDIHIYKYSLESELLTLKALVLMNSGQINL